MTSRSHGADEVRTLRPLVLPAGAPGTQGGPLRRGLFVDCETTGLDFERDTLIELALLPFTYTLGGIVAEVLEDEALSYRSDSGRPLSEEVTHLTGLTDEDLRGERVDVARAGALLARSHLVVAHNARFDRPFVEAAVPAARARPWACSRAEVPWTAEGFASQALHCLLCAQGVYARGRHRALADCEAGVWLLARRLPVSGDTVLGALRRSALRPTTRLWAVRAPFEAKDALRARGYRWMPQMRNGIERAWWTDLEPAAVEAELAWLRERVYGGFWACLPVGGIPTREVSAFERWRADPADLAPPEVPHHRFSGDW